MHPGHSQDLDEEGDADFYSRFSYDVSVYSFADAVPWFSKPLDVLLDRIDREAEAYSCIQIATWEIDLLCSPQKISSVQRLYPFTVCARWVWILMTVHPTWNQYPCQIQHPLRYLFTEYWLVLWQSYSWHIHSSSELLFLCCSCHTILTLTW